MSSSILVAGLFHETHTFVDEVTLLPDFQVRRGDEMLACSGDASPLGGVLEFAQEEGWRMIPTIVATKTASRCHARGWTPDGTGMNQSTVPTRMTAARRATATPAFF